MPHRNQRSTLAVDKSAETEAALGQLDRYQPALLIGAILVGLALARVAPGMASSLEGLVSFGVFALIYLVMLGVDASGVAASLNKPKFLATAVGLNFVVNPLLAWGLATTFLGSQPELAAGLVLFLVTPCIGWYLVFTELAGGDSQLGVSLLAVNIVLQVTLLPVYVYLLAGQSIPVDLSSLGSSIASYLIAPMALAGLTRAWARRSAQSLLQERLQLPLIKTGVLMIVIISMFASQADAIFEDWQILVSLALPMVAFFGLAFAIALGVGRLLRMPYHHLALLAFTTTSRNSEASLAIAVTAFSSPLVPLTVVIGPAIELPLLVLMVRALRLLQPSRRVDV